MNPDPVDPYATRPTLLSRIQNTSDNDSWSEFYELYAGLVHSFALQRGLTEEEARDVVQDTFIAVAKAIPEFRYNPSVGSFRSWMLHTTEWRIYDQYRKRGPRVSDAEAPPVFDPPSTGTVARVPDGAYQQLEELWDREWQQNLLERALQRVKPHISAKQFQIFDLYVLKDWPVFKVARALNVSVSQVYVARHRIAKLINQEIKRMEPRLN
ncbi:MAG: sigma-70 family RNA polymerase sigma factor [Verrucomicrobia bacterium]|nr:sigma-70 family RNA polymerase sigma factor [Verrucomicrobiota bacterium]MBI3866969.1 sigma-70 family RNA polymerase sigma factor [Verrucomicrobiota bacterium]